MHAIKAFGWPLTAVVAALAAGALMLAGLGVASSGAPGGSGPQRASSCENASTPASQATSKQLRKAVTCLVNRARSERGASRLRRVRSLQKAAQRHTRVMVETDCFEHRCPGEPRLKGRLRRAGYFDGAKRWKYAENTGCASSATAMVESWLDSTFHRLNILEPKFKDIGVGVSREGPPKDCESGFATFTAIFAWRKL